MYNIPMTFALFVFIFISAASAKVALALLNHITALSKQTIK
jgi:hypothetical protein